MKKNIFLNNDALLTLKALPTASIDLLLTDLPYGSTKLKWDKKIEFTLLWKEWLRVVKEDGALIFTATQPFATDLINSNRKLFRYDLIWEKTKPGGFLNANKMPMRSHELILVFYRRAPTYNAQMTRGEEYDKSRFAGVKHNEGIYKPFTWRTKSNKGLRYPTSVLTFGHEWNSQQQIIPTQKPEELFKYLIRTYSNPGDIVYDGFAGSGTTMVAAIKEKRNFICSEINKINFSKAVKRLKRTF